MLTFLPIATVIFSVGVALCALAFARAAGPSNRESALAHDAAPAQPAHTAPGQKERGRVSAA